MAPPTPVYNRSDILLRYHDQLKNPSKYNCQLNSLTQHECTFKVDPKNRKQPPEIICLPFKRIFQRCLIKTIVKENGKKKQVDKWINIEITDTNTNKDLLEEKSKYGKDVKDFLNAEKELKKIMESEAWGNI